MRGLCLEDSYRYNKLELVLEDDGTLTVIVGSKEYTNEQQSIELAEDEVKLLKNWLNES